MNSQAHLARVLLVDDDPVFIGRAREAIEPLATLRTVHSGRAALSTAILWKPDVVLFDLLLHDLDGFTFLDELTRADLERHPFILCTTDGRGADTRIRPLPEWRVGTLLRSSSVHDLRVAVMQAVGCQDPLSQLWITA